MVWMRGLASLAVLAAAACARNPAFALDDSADTTAAATTSVTAQVADSTTGVTSTTEPDLSSGTGSGATVTDATTTGLTTGAADDSTTTGDATTGEFTEPATCGQAKEQGTPTGITKLADPHQPGDSLVVWCEQDIADGGWMLVARSVKGGKATAFGWTHDLGDPDAFTAPYSLDAVGLGLPMSQILVGIHEGNNKPVKNAYALTVPADFLSNYADAPAKVTTVFTVLGECKPFGGPTMLQWAGYTDAKDRFRLRDLMDDQNDTFGLRVDGFQLNYPGCAFGADLDEYQGVMFVR